MDIKKQIKKFDAENKPFYMVDHGDGEYSLCLPLSSLKGEYNDFGQEAFNQYAVRTGEPVTDGRFYTHGDGYEWEYVFAKAFEGEENLKKISFDCEAGGFFCYSRDFSVLAEYGRRFREMCMNEQKFTELVCSALSEDRQPAEKEIPAEEMTSFFSAVAELAKSRGFHVKGVQERELILARKGEFTVRVDECGEINYHLCISLQGTFGTAITGITDGSIGLTAQQILMSASFPGIGNPVLMIFCAVMMGYAVIKVFFANLKRGGILLIQIAVGSLYMFSVPRGYIDGFIQWCKQVIGICMTAFLQSTILTAGLMVFKDHPLLGLGLMLSSTEVPRIAGQFGLDTSTKTNIMSSVYAAQSAINMTKTVVKAVSA